MYRRNLFSQFARRSSYLAGHPVAFAVAVGVLVIWAATGPAFGFSPSWQLVVNTGTTIVTLLLVFLIQNTQNRDSTAIQIKLDELIRVMQGAHNALLDLEEFTQEDLERIRDQYEDLATRAREELRRGGKDTGSPRVRIDQQGGKRRREG